MNIKEFKLGPMPTNCFLVWEEDKATLFDCGGENLEVLGEFLEGNKLTLEKVIFTHGHFDHIGGLDRLKELYPNIEVYIGEEEKEFLTRAELSLSNMLSGKDYKYIGEYKTLKEGDTVFGFTVIDTPGHTAGGKCFYHKDSNIVVVGDTMFRGSYGRYDLPTSNGEDLFKSLKKLCDILPNETKVYNGHTPYTTIGAEKEVLTFNNLI
ncbi:MAG: MBL fold metallo-hydrolase [Psychrilyobacter sp.]|nr:MBL fold metallo-hydrolase [Psychrilyobacter sp.]